jgi:hypothetical protein
MNHPGIYFGCVLAALLTFSIGLVLIARGTKWKPKHIKPVWVAVVTLAAACVAGSVCSMVGRDIHILYWWLLGVPLAAVFIPLVVVSTNLLVRLVLSALFSVVQRFQSKK